MIARRFRSPLLGTALVLCALAALSVPLLRLTASNEQAIRETPAGIEPESETTRAVLRMRVLDPLQDFEIRTSNDQLLHQTKTMEPGEVEMDVDILLDNNEVELHVSARTDDKETAVFLTLLPDGYEERTAYAIGSGAWEETLHFHWEHEHE